MRALMLFAAVVAATPAAADEGEITVGLATGGLFTDSLEPFDSGITAMPRVQVGLAHGVGIEADISLARGKARTADVGYQVLTPRINFYGDAMPDQRLAPFFVTGPGVFIKTVADEDADKMPTGYVNGDVDFMWNIGAGLVYHVNDKIDVRYDQRLLLNFGTERFLNHGDTFLNWEGTLGVQFTFGGKDTDKDGITDGSDACYDEAEDYDDFEDEDGCPDDDNDGDGILDANEECPNEKEDEDGFEDEDGCPESDNDEDGFLDAVDACPVDAGVESAKGCPDEDGDSVTDSMDACPADAGSVDTAGCPDSDGDQVVDNIDECPEEPGSADAFGCVDDDSDGVPDGRDACPEEAGDPGAYNKYATGCAADVYAAIDQIVFKQPIAFKGLDVIADESKPHLDAAAKILNDNEELVVKINVHSDKAVDGAKAVTNTKLQAASLKQYLLDQGVPGRRIGVKGHGDRIPPEGSEEPKARILFNLEYIVEEPVEKDEAPMKDEAPAKDEGAEAPKDEAPAKDEGAEAPKDEAPAKDEGEEAPKDEAPAKDEGDEAKEEAPAKEETPAKEEAPADDKAEEPKEEEAPKEE